MTNIGNSLSRPIRPQPRNYMPTMLLLPPRSEEDHDPFPHDQDNELHRPHPSPRLRFQDRSHIGDLSSPCMGRGYTSNTRCIDKNRGHKETSTRKTRFNKRDQLPTPTLRRLVVASGLGVSGAGRFSFKLPGFGIIDERPLKFLANIPLSRTNGEDFEESRHRASL